MSSFDGTIKIRNRASHNSNLIVKYYSIPCTYYIEMDLPNFNSKDLYCPNHNCKGELLLSDVINTDYDWAILLQCN